MNIQSCYEDGIAKHGPGAVVIHQPSEWVFESITQLRQQFPDDVPVKTARLWTFPYQSEDLIDLIHEVAEVAPNCFVIVKRSPRLGLIPHNWRFNLKLLVDVYPRLSASLEAQEPEPPRALTPDESHRLKLWLDYKVLEEFYLREFDRHGAGAVVGNILGMLRYVPLAKLHRVEAVKIDENGGKLQLSLVEIVEQCMHTKFVCLQEVYQPFWPVGRHLRVTLMPFEVKSSYL